MEYIGEGGPAGVYPMTAIHAAVSNRGFTMAKQVRVNVFKVLQDGQDVSWMSSPLKWSDAHQGDGEKQFEPRDIRRGWHNRQTFDICRSDSLDKRLNILCKANAGFIQSHWFTDPGTYDIYVSADADGMMSIPAELVVTVAYEPGKVRPVLWKRRRLIMGI